MVDECTGPAVAQWLQVQGHEIYSIYDQAHGLEDDQIVQKAFAENWILITNDKDFGQKVYRESYPHHGVILLRLEDERSSNKIVILRRLIDTYSDRLLDSVVVVTETRVRFARRRD